MFIPEIVENIVAELRKYSRPEPKLSFGNSKSTSMKVIGLVVPDQRTVLQEWQKKLAHYSAPEWIQLAMELVETNILECQQIAFELLWKNKKALQQLTPEQIFRLGKTLDNWVSVDMFCLCITGYCWRTGILSDADILNWARHPDFWLRRTALVSTVPLNLRSRGGTGDQERTLRICSLLAGDHQEMIVKAMSWALRELSKSDRQAVEEFLLENRDILHSKVIREVQTKLLTGKKNG